jgi:hypothetical protein
MVRTRHTRLVVMLGLVLGATVLGTACKKEGTTSATGDKAGEAQGGGGNADDMSLLPADSEMVIGLNFAQLQQSQLWKQFVEPKLTSGESQKKLTEIKARCGWDPMTAMSSIVVGIKDTSGNKPAVVVVGHGLDKTKMLECLDKSKDDITKDGGEMTKDGDVVLFKDKTGETGAVTFVNNTTAVMAFGGGRGNAAGVKALVAGTAALKTSAPFVEMYKKVKTGDSLWGLASGKILDKLPVKATAAYGSLNVTDGLAVDMRVRFEKAEDATQAASMVNAQTQQAAKFFDKAEFAADGTELHGTIVMSNQKLQTLIQQFGPMLGAFSGMGGQ